MTDRASSSASATSSATGGWLCTRRSEPRSTLRGRWRSPPVARTLRPGRAVHAQRRRHRDPPPDSDAEPRAVTSRCSARTRSGSSRRAGRLGRVRVPVPRVRAAFVAAPRRDPQRRTAAVATAPTANQLLQVASEYGDFPSRSRRCASACKMSSDVPPDGFCARFLAASVRLVRSRTQEASPFARSLLFRLTSACSLRRRRAAGRAPGRRRCRSTSRRSPRLLGSTDLRELFDAAAIAAVEAELQRLPEIATARGVGSVARLLRGVGRPHLPHAGPRATAPRPRRTRGGPARRPRAHRR